VSVGHYENFPVASLLLPKRLRWPVAVIYAFARSADDFADEGEDAPDVRLAKLEAYRTELNRIASRTPPQTPLFPRRGAGRPGA
jgi:phytoene synthase